MRLLRNRRFLIAVLVAVAIPVAFLLARSPGPDAALIAPVKRGEFTVIVTTAGELRARNFVQITVPPNAMQAGAYQMKISSIVFVWGTGIFPLAEMLRMAKLMWPRIPGERKYAAPMSVRNFASAGFLATQAGSCPMPCP